MRRRIIAGGGAAATVVLGGVSSALINELHGGWGWWLGASGAVLVSAALTGWLATRPATPATGDQLGPGAVKAGRDITGSVTTHTTITPDAAPPPPEAW